MGCLLRSIGCLVLLVIGAAAAWIFRDRIPFLRRDVPVTSAAVNPWQPLTPEGAARAKAQVASLAPKSGPVFTNVKGADLAAYIFQELSRQLPPSAENPEAAILNDELCVRASVAIGDLGGAKALGPLASMFGNREPAQFCGTLEIIRSGLGEFHVKSLKVRELSIPSGAIPRLLRNIEQGGRPAGVADDALPLKVPSYVGDVRIAKNHITLYKTNPPEKTQ